MMLELPTACEIEQIRNNDVAIISKYYFANYEYIKRYATAFCRRLRYFDELEDYIQQIFVEFPRLDFDNARFFGHSCFKVFCEMYYGNLRKRTQLKQGKAKREETIFDAPLKGMQKDVTFGETLSSDFDTYTMAFPCPLLDDVLFEFLSAYFADEQKKVFEQIYWTGQTYNEIADTLHKNVFTVKRTREEIFKILREHKEQIRLFLDRLESSCPILDKTFCAFLCGFLKDEQKKVFEQFFECGKHWTTIAQALGKHPNTVRGTWKQCLKNFRKHNKQIKLFVGGVDDLPQIKE